MFSLILAAHFDFFSVVGEYRVEDTQNNLALLQFSEMIRQHKQLLDSLAKCALEMAADMPKGCLQRILVCPADKICTLLFIM